MATASCFRRRGVIVVIEELIGHSGNAFRPTMIVIDERMLARPPPGRKRTGLSPQAS
jgi:hypothetical protein